MKKNLLAGGPLVTVLVGIVCIPWNNSFSEAGTGSEETYNITDTNRVPMGEAVCWDTSRVNEVVN